MPLLFDPFKPATRASMHSWTFPFYVTSAVYAAAALAWLWRSRRGLLASCRL